MKLRSLVTGLCLSTFLVSCEDVASNRKMGTNKNPPTIQAVEGNGSDLIRSHMHRKNGSPVIPYAEEIVKTLSNELPENLYRNIPLMDTDDEGSSKNVITRDELGRATEECGTGTEFAGIDARITHCSQKNGDKAIWNGTNLGASGEGIWKLVSRSAAGNEIWFDGRTGMVWSDMIKKDTLVSFNWCKASGNDEDDTPNEVINCRTLGEAVSLCANNSIAGLETQVKWRLPTRNDFLQADLNGSRFVMKKENDSGLWTATIRAASSGRNEAWVYDSTEGTLAGGKMTDLRQVRCIGTPVR